MKLMAFEKQILTAVGLVYDDDGFVSRREGSKTEPLSIKGQRLVLATPTQLANPDWQHRVVFNPLYESLSRKESPVHEAFRTILNVRLNELTGLVVGFMLSLSAKTEKHAELSPEQTEFLSVVKKVDDAMLKSYEKLLDAFPGDRAFVNIYSKPGARINDETFSRGAIVSFPIYEALNTAEVDGSKVTVKAPGKNVSIRGKDREAFLRLLEYIVPNIKVKHFYDVGSLSTMCPIMESLLKAAAAMFVPLNQQINVLHDRIANAGNLLAPMDWVEELDNIGTLYREARERGIMNGNETPPPSQVTAPAPAQVAQPVHVAAAPAPAPAPTREEVKINPITGKPLELAPATPVAAGFPAPNVVVQPQSQWQAPPAAVVGGGFPAPMPFQGHQPPSVVKPNGKADLAAIFMSNPALAAAAGAVQPFQGQGYNPQPQERAPGWAQGGFSQPMGMVGMPGRRI